MIILDSRLLQLANDLSQITKPPPKRNPAEWARQRRILPITSSEPGPFRPERTPWVVPICAAIADYRYNEVVAVMGSQLGKTDGVILNAVGWRFDDNPIPTLIYLPTQKAAESLSKDRINKMLRSLPDIWSTLDKKTNKISEKFIKGVRLGMGWVSKTEVASHPAGMVFFDEVDRIAPIKGEGDPYELTRVRGSSYPNFTQVSTSSPTVGDVTDEQHSSTGLFHWKVSSNVKSRSWLLWQSGTRHEFMLPCPHCGQYFSPKLSLLYYPDSGSIEEETKLRCPHCAVLIEQHHKHDMTAMGLMISPGQWVDNGCIKGEPLTSKTYSAWVSGLCSPWVSWGQRAVEYSRAVEDGEHAIIQSIVNTRFGELFTLKGESPAWELVSSLKTASNYRIGTIPDEVQFLTTGVDVQSNRLVVVVMGWTLNDGQREGYLIEYVELFGNTAYDDVWTQLEDEFIYREFAGGRSIIETGIDSGFNPSKFARSKFARSENKDRNIIYDFCRRNRMKVVPTKGNNRPMLQEYAMKHIDVHVSGKTNKAGLTLYLVNQSEIKKTIYKRLEWDLKRPGHWHFPSDTPDQFFQQLTAEELIDGEWRQTGENHVLDCVVINYFLVLKHRRLFASEQATNVVATSQDSYKREDSPYISPHYKREDSPYISPQSSSRPDWW